MLNYCPDLKVCWKASRRWLYPLRIKMNDLLFKILVLIFIMDAITLSIIFQHQWITVCGLFSDKLTEELLVNEIDGGKLDLSSISSDSILCLKIGLYEAEVSISSTSYLVRVDIDSPSAFRVCIILILTAVCCLACITVLFLLANFAPVILVRFGLNVEKSGILFSVVSFILLSYTVIEFTMYKESTVDANPIIDPFKYMMNNFSSSYGSTYFLSIAAVVCNGFVCFLTVFLFQKSKSKVCTVKKTLIKLRNRSFV